MIFLNLIYFRANALLATSISQPFNTTNNIDVVFIIIWVVAPILLLILFALLAGFLSYRYNIWI